MTSKVDAKSDGSFFTVLVPGCGGGHDLQAIAEHCNAALDNSAAAVVVTGLDLATTSLDKAAGNLKDYNGACTIQLMQGDFFDVSSWVQHSTMGGKNVYDSSDPTAMPKAKDSAGYDFIFDYTFFCALSPALRPQWGEQMGALLAANGMLLTLMFPLGDGAPDQGPPFTVSVQAYRDVLEPHGVQMAEASGAPRVNPNTVGPRKDKEKACWWQKK